MLKCSSLCMPMPTVRNTVIPFALVSLLGLNACGDPIAPLCSAPIDIEVSAGTTPTFTWDPVCSVEGMFVEDQRAPSVGGPQAQWGFVARAGYRFEPPVVYGTEPSGAEVTVTAVPLMAGRLYTVKILMNQLVGTTNIVGTKSFQP
jgi:hypothetical protein